VTSKHISPVDEQSDSISRQIFAIVSGALFHFTNIESFVSGNEN